MAHGGEGAPLVPLVDRLLFAHPREDRLVLNIGGIANITVLPAGGGAGLAFDTGPGNALIDATVARFSGERCDRDGVRAGRGHVDASVLAELLQHDFLRREPPKSTGREEFGAAFLADILGRRVLRIDRRTHTRYTVAGKDLCEGLLVLRQGGNDGFSVCSLWAKASSPRLCLGVGSSR